MEGWWTGIRHLVSTMVLAATLFAGTDDYYARTSSAPLIAHIRLPTLVLTARDDPFIAVGPFERLAKPRHVEVRITDHGGHAGFLGWDGTGGICWGERQVVDWLMK